MNAVSDNVPAMSYGRVSRSENADDLYQQHNICRAYAQENGFVIIEHREDIGSGYNEILQRRELVRMLNTCHSDGINHIIVSSLSRLTRSVRDGILLLDWFHRRGISLHVCDKVKSSSETGYLDLMRTLFDAEALRNKFVIDGGSTNVQGLHGKGRPPLGYKNDTKRKGTMVTDTNCKYNISSIFEKALNLRSNFPTHSISDIAKSIGPEIIDEGKTIPSASTITRILNNPVYTGRLAPLGTHDLEILRQYPHVHDLYISDESFVTLHKGKSRRKLHFLELVMCSKCGVNLNLNEDNARCPNCNINISINQFHEKMLLLCRRYIYDPDSTFEHQLNSMWSTKQVEALLSNIITLGTSSNSTHIFTPSRSDYDSLNEARTRIGEEWKKLKLDMKKLQQNSYDLPLHYRMRRDAKDEGRGLRDFIEDAFGGVIVTLKGRGKSTIYPKELKPGVKATIPLSDEAFNRDMAIMQETIKKRVKLIRELLHDNPFLSDFLAYHIIDDRFRQWEDAISYVDDAIKFNPFI